jgi:hypothetical protein
MRCFVMAFVFLSASAIGQTASTPDSFLGVKFGRSVVAQFPQCLRGTSLSPTAYKLDGDQPEQCWTQGGYGSSPESYGIVKGPQLVVGYSLTAEELSGAVESLTVWIKPQAYSLWIDILTQRYGKAATVVPLQVQTRAGQVYQSETTRWVWGNLEIEASKYAGSLNDGLISITTAAWREKNKNNANSAIKDSASHL